jgi:uncharacterized protein (DUF924 family)
MHSGTPAAFAYDDVAVAATLDAIAAGADREMSAAELLFLFTPLMHSESAAHQAESVKQFTALTEAHGAWQRVRCHLWRPGCLRLASSLACHRGTTAPIALASALA